MPITFLDEEEPKPAIEPTSIGDGGVAPLDQAVEPTKNKITFLDEEPTPLEQLGLRVPEPPKITPLPEPEPQGDGFFRQAADVPLKIGESINTSLKGLTDLFGADNAISQNLTQNAEWYRSLLSAQALQDEQEISRILQDAENKGITDQLAAGLEAFSVAPVDFVASGLGSLAVFAATGLAGRAAAAAGVARAGLTGARAAAAVQRGVQATQIATGAAMGAGIVKGEIYQSVKNEMLSQGKNEEEAKRIAMEAQSYGGKNLDQILIGAGLGTIDALTGAEKIIGKVLTKGGLAPNASRIGNILKNGITEGAPEFIQAAQEKFASNLALQREGANVSLTQGVFSQGALEGLVGVGLGAGAGAIEPRTQPATKEEIAAAAAETQDVARQNKDVAPATASLVEGQAEQIVQTQETPEQKVARLQEEARASAEIPLEEEPIVGVEPTVPVTPPAAPTPEGVVAPVEPVVEPVVAEPQPAAEVAPEAETVRESLKSGVEVFHGGQLPETITEVRAFGGLHAGTQKAAEERIGIPSEAGQPSEISKIVVTAENPYLPEGRILDESNGADRTQLFLIQQLPEERQKLIDAGYDVIPYKNAIEDPNSVSYLILDPRGYTREGDRYVKKPAAEAVPAATPPAEVAPTPEAVTPTPEAPNLEPLRRVARAEQAPEDIPSLVEAGLVELYKDQPVLTEAGLAALPEAERPRLTPEARKIQIDTGSNEVVAEAIAKNLRIGVDQVGANVRMPAGWKLVEDIYVPPARQEVAPAPEVRESRREPAPLTQQDREYLDAVERGDLGAGSRAVNEAAKSAGYTIKAYHGTTEPDITVFSGRLGSAVHVALNKNTARSYADNYLTLEAGQKPSIYEVFVNVKNTFDARNPDHFNQIGLRYPKDFPWNYKDLEENINVIKAAGFDSYFDYEESTNTKPDGIAVFNERMVKLANTITKDDRGNIIPPSQRFQTTEEDIRYARREQDLSNALDSGDYEAAQALVDGGATLDRTTFLRSIRPAATQRATTIHTRLEKDGIISKDEFANEQGLVYGDGRGAASQYLGSQSYEPYPPVGFEPTYTGDRVAGEGAPIDKKFRAILNTFVLNVVDPETRAFIVKDIANLLVNGGRAVFVTRGKDVATSKALVSFGPLERIQRSEGKLTYQKGFTQPELIQYLQETLGGGFEVRALRGGSASDVRVEVVKNTDATLDNSPLVQESREGRRIQMPRTAGMETEAVATKLESLGFGRGGIVSVVNEPDASFEGRTIIRDGKVVAIELNAAALKDDAAVERVLNHEIAESANADGALNTLVAGLTPKERKEINDAITRLGYAERARTAEEAARAVELLAEGWRGRRWFERAVARIEAWANKLGYKLTRRAAEYIAARNVSEINAEFKQAYNKFINVQGEAREGRAFVTPAENARFLELAKNPEANREELQKMVDAAAERAGYDVSQALYRGFARTPKPTKFVTRRGRSVPSFTPIQEIADLYQYTVEFFQPQKKEGARLYRFYSKMDKPLDLREYGTRANLWDIVSTALNWDFSEKPQAGTWNIGDAQNLIYELWQKESNGFITDANYELTSSDSSGFMHQTFRDLNETIEETEDPETIEYLLSGIEIDVYALADAVEFVDAAKSAGFDGIIHKDTIESGVEYLEDIAKKPVTEIEGIDVEEDYSFDTYRPFDMGQTKLSDPVTRDDQGNVIPLSERFQPTEADIRYSIRESRREDAIPTFSEGSPEASTLSTMAASMAKVDAASEAKPTPEGKTTYKISEIASVWMDQGGDARQLQDMVVEYTNLTPANAKRVADAIAKQYDIQQSIATAFVETPIGLSVEALPEGVSLPKEVDPDRPRPVMQRLFDVFMGVRVKPTMLTVNEKSALKDQIRLKAAANREAKKAQQQTASEVIDIIKSMELRGPVRPKQAQALAKRAAKVIWTSEKSLESFIAYAERVVANTNYDADLSEAKLAQRRAAELSKRKTIAAPQREILSNISKIGVNMLQDPREFADAVNYYMRGFKSVISPDYVVIPDSEIIGYLSQAEDIVNEAKAEFDRVVTQRLAEKYNVPPDKIQEILDSEDIEASLVRYAKREVAQAILNEKAEEVMDGLRAYDQDRLRLEQQKILNEMLKLDPTSLSNEQKQRLIRVGNNIIFNDQTNGAEFFAVSAKGQQMAREAASDENLIARNKAWVNILPTLRSRALEKTWRNIAVELQSVADTFRNAFGKGAMGRVYRMMGMYDLDVGFTKAANTIDQIQEEIAAFYNGLEKKYKAAARNQDGILAEGVVGFLIQGVPEKGEADSLAQRRSLIVQDIRNRRASNDPDRVAMADRIEAILQQLDGDTVEEIMANLKRDYRPNYDSVMWLKDTLFPKYKEFLKRFDENFNDQANNYENPDYLPIGFVRAGPSLAITPENEAMYYDHVSMRPKQSAYTIKRVDYTTLPTDRTTGEPKEIEFNLRRNAFDSLSDQISKAYTSPAWQQIFSFMNSSDSERLFGGKANKQFFIERLNRLKQSRMRRGSLSTGYIEKVADTVSVIARKLGTGIALGGAYQPFKQVPDQFIAAVGTTGRADLMSQNVAPSSLKAAKELLSKFSIGRRGDASSGYKYINQMEGAQNRIERYISESRWDAAKEQAGKIADVWMLALKKSDFAFAAAAWMTYYQSNLAEAGIEFQGWENEAKLLDGDPARQDAAAYAEQMTDIYQGSSDPTKMASFVQSGKSGWENLFKAVFVPFNSFAVQQRMRIYSDARDMMTKSGDDKKRGTLGLASTIGGLIAFHSIRRFALPALTGLGLSVLYAAFGVDMDEPDEEKKAEDFAKRWRQFLGEFTANLLVGGSGQIVEAATIDSFNYAAYSIAVQAEDESVLNDKGEVMSFSQYSKERSPFWRYRSFDNAMSLGMFDIGIDQAKKAVLESKTLMDAEEMENYTPEEQRLLYFAAVSDWFYLMRLNDADFARMIERARREIKARSKETEKELKKIREGL